jgi:aerobic-type carbon monoxide dehydrogenase small subunit (CoxS/CutS family)
MSDDFTKGSKLSRRGFLGSMGVTLAVTGTRSEALPPEEVQENHIPGTILLHCQVNAREHTLAIEPQATLAEVLRRNLGLTGTKLVCSEGHCGGCTVVVDGKAVYACHVLAIEMEGCRIVTIEGLMKEDHLHVLQQAFIEKDGLQCGYCTPGQIMSAYALLQGNDHPDEEEVRRALSGNLCRCGAYQKILDSVMLAAERLKAKGEAHHG